MSVSNKEKEIALPVPNIAKRKPLSKAERKSVYRKYNGHCAYCGKKFKSRWWFTQSSKNTATVVAKGLARKCYYSHFADL